jgi:gluconate kinase
MNLIIVGGQTSTGKSTISRKLAADLRLRYCLKDDYKEQEYFATLGERPNLWGLYQAERASWHVVYQAVQAAQAKGYDLLIEGNFTGAQKRRLRAMLHHGTNVVELYLYARGFTIYHRYVARDKSGERHPGHRDSLWYWVPWLEALTAHVGLRWVYPMRLGGAVLRIDATDFVRIDYAQIRSFVTEHLN